VERFQQTLKRWLRRQDRRRGLARDLAELQARLDEFVAYYNKQRPHQGIGRVTPLSRWQASPAASAGDPLPHRAPRPAPRTVTVRAGGNVKVDQWIIGVGVEWAGCDATVLLDDRYATVFADGQLVRHLKLDASRTYQPTGRLRGGPRQRRRLTS
jgi:Integrase core domain